MLLSITIDIIVVLYKFIHSQKPMYRRFFIFFEKFCELRKEQIIKKTGSEARDPVLIYIGVW